MEEATQKSSWEARRDAALILYKKEDYTAAAALIWSYGEVPFRSNDIAICVKILAKTQRDDAIRLLREVSKRNTKKPEWCLSLAAAFYEQGMPILASRFYGAALSVSNMFYENSFEEESLWADDHGSLVELWKTSGEQPLPPDVASMKSFIGNAMSFYEYTQKITLKAEAEMKKEEIPKEEVKKESMLPPVASPTMKLNFPG